MRSTFLDEAALRRSDDDDDDESNSSQASGHNSHSSSIKSYATSMHSVSESKKEQEYSFEQRMTKVVARWRTCVILMLFITAALVVTTTYVFLSDNEEKEFEKSFEKSAKSIMDSIEFHAKGSVETFETLADSLTSEALSSGQTWPYVTSQHWEVKAAHARMSSFAEVVMFMPVVWGRDRQEWEAYSVQGASAWLQQSQELGKETSQWLYESDHYHLPGDNDGEKGTGEAGSESSSSSSNNNNNRHLETSQRHLGTLIEVISFDNDTSAVEADTEETGSTAETLVPPTTANHDAVFAPEEIPPEIFLKGEDMPGGMEGDVTQISESWRTFYAPVWQISPPPKQPSLINYNILADANSAGTLNAIQVSGNRAVVSELLKTSSIDFFYKDLMTNEEHWGYHSSSSGANDGTASGAFPHSSTIAPVRDSFDANASIVGFVAGTWPWDPIFSRLLPEGTNGVYAVLSNSCAQVVTYRISGPTAFFLGEGDLHETKYDYLKSSLSFTGFGISTEESRRVGQCDYFLDVFPSKEYRKDYDDNRPEIFTTVLAAVFVATGLVFLVFAVYVQRRQHLVMDTALKTNAIVASLFPANVRARIMKDAEETALDNKNKKNESGRSESQNLKGYLHKENLAASTVMGMSEDSDGLSTNVFGSRPIADLFPATTIMFGDIAGFTAWSSVREPTQVFALLETLYHAFDEIAKRRRVFKVETIGDCYVAVTGLPEPRKDHASMMARFARDCMTSMNDLTKKLEVSLGPDTGDLALRIGLHSGPVTAGVLRGARARFQLFGDTMNTCARVETTGCPGRIHISQQTADLLKSAGKESWYQKRPERVKAKGKGELQTYWLVFKRSDSVSISSSVRSESSRDEENFDLNDAEPDLGTGQVAAKRMLPDGSQEFIVPTKLSRKAERLVAWNVDILSRLLEKIVAGRQSNKAASSVERDIAALERELNERKERGTVMDEVKEIIQLPKYDTAVAQKKERRDSSVIKLPANVRAQLKSYVSAVAGTYRENDSVPFHNFEHASHVTMSVTKLLSRIVEPANVDGEGDLNKELHDHTYGIASDPLTQLGIVLSALIHDADHLGVPNSQLVKENVPISAQYNHQSVAEQNSVDICWHLLMQPAYKDLRAAIYASPDELQRFRQLIVNTVLATDIMDKQLKDLRNSRWDRAFYQAEESVTEEDPIQPDSFYNDDATNRKATIVIEHIIQASDVAHTMQHWHIYRKWNERFFFENMIAFKTGRAERDPSEFWYKGEIGFFDFYIIPLAKKLRECGVFGVSSDEYLDYCMQNREEWVSKGEAVVAEMIANYASKMEENGGE